MILLATNKRDVTTDFVALELERRGIPFFRLNTEDVHLYRVTLENGDPAVMRLEGKYRSLDLATVTGAYYRRPLPPEFPDHTPAIAQYLQAEWSAILRSLWNALEGRWLNCPFAILRAEDKPRQLSSARAVGFDIPETLVTNHAENATRFVAAAGTVAKPLRHAMIEDGDTGRVIFTSRANATPKVSAAIEQAPIIFQREIAKRSDVRVIVVDKAVFATAIASQAHEETSVDWRRGVRTDLEHTSIDLPDDVEGACVALTKKIGLRYAAIDLIEDQAGLFWFLEANPNGQWAWIEQRTGVAISAAIVDALLA